MLAVVDANGRTVEHAQLHLHAKTWGAPVDVATLIPHMLETFIARDRGFRKATRAASTSRTATANVGTIKPS